MPIIPLFKINSINNLVYFLSLFIWIKIYKTQMSKNRRIRINKQIVVHPTNGTTDGIQDSLKLVSMESFKHVETYQNSLTLKRYKIA